ncbi:MAG: trigger factor [Deltaproteobacteria bacterium]|nr:trigger factor [Deltaproteobacteria bacterium]
MKTSVEPISAVKKRIRVEVPADEVARRMEEGFAEVRRMVPIRGFRKGKAPLAMVRRLFRESVEQDVAEGLVKESLSEAFRENNLRVLSLPEVEGAKVEDGKEFSFTATVETAPEVEPKDYKGLPVVQEKVEATDEQVEASLESLRESFAQYHPVEGRGAAEPDLLEVSLSTSADGVPVESVSSTSVLLGTGRPFGKEFEEKLAGVRPGEERAFAIAFPAGVPNPKYAGKTVTFRMTVQSVREKRLPALDEELAKNFNDIQDLATLRARMRERLLAEGEEQARRRMENEIRNGLLERNVFEVPPILVDRQVVEMIDEMARRMTSQGVDLKKVRLDFEKMRERFAPGAEKAVRATLLLAAIAKKEGIDVPYSEMEAEMKAMADASGMAFEKVREITGEEERLEELRNRLMERKVMAFLASHAVIREEGGTA